MKDTHIDWRWEEGEVDKQGEHIELVYGKVGETPDDGWTPLARVAKPIQQLFTVEWLVAADTPEQQSMLDKARRELDFYLVELAYPDPWAYARYHCNTASNIYSSVHWCYSPGEG